jgi:hypothetical protein
MHADEKYVEFDRDRALDPASVVLGPSARISTLAASAIANRMRMWGSEFRFAEFRSHSLWELSDRHLGPNLKS